MSSVKCDHPQRSSLFAENQAGIIISSLNEENNLWGMTKNTSKAKI